MSVHLHGRAAMAFVMTCLAALLASLLSTPANAQGIITSTTDPSALADAIVDESGVLTGASFLTRPPGGTTTAVATLPLGGLPSAGGSYAILTSGDPQLADDPNTSESSGVARGGGAIRGDTDRDVTILAIDVDVPSTVNCLVGLDFRFLSDEFAEYVGSSFNDAFIAELDNSTWTTSGSQIIAPDNFAFDPDGKAISINAAGETSMSAEEAAGTTYDGATPLLTAATPITPGDHTLFLSIFDQGDQAYDSAVFVDNLRFGTVADVATDCVPGAELADPTRYVALGDSYSSGFGVSPYEAGTNNDPGPNNCQRSTSAYSELVAARRNLNLDFNACQGGVTQDFAVSRDVREGAAWGEDPQYDHLDAQTGLVTFTIGGNDAKFADVLAECILGFELLPFNTCHNDGKVTEPIREAFDRLDGQTATPADIISYPELYEEVRNRAPFATVVLPGYPHFYPANGGDRTFLPGGRCEGVKKADQRWMVERIDELNDIIERNALRNGFLFTDPSPRFADHELCSGGEEWIFPLLSGGRIHPTAAGHDAIADAIEEALDNDPRGQYIVGLGQTVSFSVLIDALTELFNIVTQWPGSDVVMTLRTPSGLLIQRNTSAPDVLHDLGPATERYQISNPEAGEWTVELFGADVDPDGEQVLVTTLQEEAPNQPPAAVISWARGDGEILLDGSGSSDPDGDVVAWDWYVTGVDSDEVVVGEQASVGWDGRTPLALTLVVTDDDAATDFADLLVLPMDIKPDSADNPVNPRSKGVIPVTLYSSEFFDATTVDTTTLAFGPGAAPVAHAGGHVEDVDGDGLDDLVLHFRTQASGVRSGMTQLCLDGVAPDGTAFRSCDAIRTTGR